jgi:glycine betaine/proline transport system substrate-binding protein
MFINLSFEIIATNSLDAILNPFELYTLPLEDWITNSVNYVVDNYRPFFQAIRLPISWTLESIQWLFLTIPPLIFIILLGLLAWQLAGSKIAIFSVIALTLIGFVGAWEQAVVSLSLILTAVAFCMVVGISLGILCASNEKLEKWLQPILDAMQTLPSFVYLVPVVMLFGIGEVSGVIATFIFAVPPLVRLTNLGIKQVSEEVVEAATAFGSTPKQMLWEVQIPLAMPTILAGVNQAILLALSMSVVTSMIGVQGLGGMVLQGLGSLNVGLASVGGLSIVLIAIMLDRMTHVLGQSDSQFNWKQSPPISFFFSKSTRYVAIFASTILGVLLLTSIWQQTIPNTAQTTKTNALPGTGIEIKSAHSSLLEERFQTEIVNIALRKLGYETPEPQQIEYTTMHVALGNGELDYTPVHWEKGHNEFFEQSGGEEKLERVGVISANLLQGYQIDKKTADQYNITNIEQLKDPKIAKLFDSDGDGKANLTGCNAGWGCQKVIDHHLKVYGLEDTVEHDQGTYSALIADTITRYKQGQPVLYYTWTPMWMAGELKVGEDVVWLEVPFTSLPKAYGNVTEKDTTAMGKNLGFAIDDIRILANKKFVSENPAAKRLFEQIKIPVEDINEENQKFKNGENSVEDIRRHAREWVRQHQDEFNNWVDEAKKAASQGSTTSQSQQPGFGVEVKSVHSTLQEERFQTDIVNMGLKQLGYEIPEPKRIEYTTMHLALGQGDLDYTPVHWEKGHNQFFEQSGGEEKLERVGVISANLLQGYQIDKKTADQYNITNIEQLKDPEIAKLFDSDGDGKANLTGCNAGWGCELVVDHHLKAYGLEDTVEHDKGTYSALIADTITRYKQGQPVLYYTWTPMWMAGELKVDEDVVWLEVPYTSLPKAYEGATEKDTTAMGKNLGFAIDDIRILANKEFLNKNPAAKRFFELVKIPVDDNSFQNQLFKNGENSDEDIRRHAQEWIDKHQDKFTGWVEEARKAGNN